MTTNLKQTDVVLIGVGGVGGIAALPLAQAGLEVIGLEAGTWLTSRDYPPDELRNNLRAWPVKKTNQEIPTYRPTASAPYSPRMARHPMMNAVGGSSIHYSAQSWRLSPWDFKVVSETTRRYGASRIPKGSTIDTCSFQRRPDPRRKPPIARRLVRRRAPVKFYCWAGFTNGRRPCFCGFVGRERPFAATSRLFV